MAACNGIALFATIVGFTQQAKWLERLSGQGLHAGVTWNIEVCFKGFKEKNPA